MKEVPIKAVVLISIVERYYKLLWQAYQVIKDKLDGVGVDKAVIL